jgi:SAM-dependent methyltransferase
LNRLKRLIPWWAKIAAKILLSRLPLPYRFWKRAGLFVHGNMDNAVSSVRSLLLHAQTAGLLAPGAQPPRFKQAGTGFKVLEIGPGDSLSTALAARLMGADQIWLVDSGPFASTALTTYHQLAHHLGELGYDTEPFARAQVIGQWLDQCQASYLTEGVASLAGLPDASVDFCFSNAVLEHIPAAEFRRFLAEHKRILKPGGVGVHRVDLQDHLGGRLDNLRFSERVWESALFRRAGFYTNRIRFRTMQDIFTQAGFVCSVPRCIRWDTLPTPRSKMQSGFAALDDENLLVKGFDLVLRLPAGQVAES